MKSLDPRLKVPVMIPSTDGLKEPPAAHIYNSETKPQTFDPVTAPAHYLQTKYSPTTVIEDWSLGFHLGNAIKYIGRSKYKGNELEDLKKAQWYLKRYIDLLEGK